MTTYYVLQKASNPSVFYKEKRGEWQSKLGTSIILTEVNHVDKATKFNSVKHINKSLDKVFHNKNKSNLTDMSDGFKVIKCESTIVYVEETNLDSETSKIIDDLKLSSKLIKDTHYSAIELFSKIRNDPKLVDYKFILSTTYDRLITSTLHDTFVNHGLEPIKHKGNFAFNREDYWTAAKLVCDVPYKSYNLNDEKVN